MKKEIALTGIQPTGIPHIGNYLGSMKQMIDMSRAQDSFTFVADLHSLNDIHDPAIIREYTMTAATSYIALGLDMSRTILFRQSDVPEVLELSGLLMNVTSKGLMNRAHSYKAAVDRNAAAGRDTDAGINMGLYTYPILMTADILLYNATTIPVGADQKQHVEFARDIAGAFNNIYGETFILPEPVIKESVGLIPGTDGRKMSKSYGNTIQIFAPEEELKKKIMGITTDSTRPEDPKDPDTSTIFKLYSGFATADEIALFREKFTAGGVGYGALKTELFEKINEFLAPRRAELERLMANPDEIESILAAGAARARPHAAETLARVKRAMLG